MIKINEEELLNAMNESGESRSLKLFRKRIRRNFRGIMPKKFGIFPGDPKVYRMSKTICIEMPSWGSYGYRVQLSTLINELKEYFICDVEYFDGKTTVLVKEWKKKA